MFIPVNRHQLILYLLHHPNREQTPDVLPNLSPFLQLPVLPLCFVDAVAFYTPFWLVLLWSGSPLGSACAAFYVIESRGLMLLPGML